MCENLVDRVGPVRMDANAVHVRHDQQRRIIKRNGILLELQERLVEILALALVFPGKTVLAPHIGPAIATGSFAGALLEGEPCPLGSAVTGSRISRRRQRSLKWD